MDSESPSSIAPPSIGPPASVTGAQGQHIDPEHPRTPAVDPSTWSARRRRAYNGAAMAAYRAALLRPGLTSTREAVIDDLSSFYGFSPQECVARCLHWESWSVAEWNEKDRRDAAEVAAFYHTTKSWSFDLLWYAYVQAEGHSYPVSAAIAETLPTRGGGKRHLDYGSGVGATTGMFLGLGYESEMADISTTLLSFARHRFERRSQPVRMIDLNQDSLPENRYDVITAIDTLAHVPDVPAAVDSLYRALRPGGVLFANFDVRPPAPESAWHLYSDDLPLRWEIQRAGFEPEYALDGMITRYRWVNRRALTHAVRGARDYVALRSPLRPLYRQVKAIVKNLRA